MIDVERLVELLAAKYRWGLHPFKLFLALLAPVLTVWVADRWLRVHEPTAKTDEAFTSQPTASGR